MSEDIGSAEKQGGFVVRLSDDEDREIMILPPEAPVRPMTDWQIENLIMSLEIALWEKDRKGD